MTELTIQDIATKTGLPKEAAYSLIQFLQKAGLANKGSGRKPGGKGKGVSTYLMAETMPEATKEILAKLVGDENQVPAEEESDDTESEEADDASDEDEDDDEESEDEDSEESDA